MAIPIDLGQRVIARAIEQAGGMEAVALTLDIHPILLKAYIEGKREIPETLFVHMVDLAMAGDGQRIAPQS